MISVIKPDHLRHHCSFIADLYQLSAILSNYYVIIFCYLKDLIIVNPSAASYKYKIIIKKNYKKIIINLITAYPPIKGPLKLLLSFFISLAAVKNFLIKITYKIDKIANIIKNQGVIILIKIQADTTTKIPNTQAYKLNVIPQSTKLFTLFTINASRSVF